MESVSLDVLNSLKESFDENLASIINELGTRYNKIGEHTLLLEKIQEKSIEKICNEIDRGISANEEFHMHCLVLSKELEGIENLAKQIHAMRKHCEDLEKKLLKTK